jgi:hypothetical protein
MQGANDQADKLNMLRGGLRCQDVTRGLIRQSEVAGNDVEAQAHRTADCFAGVAPKVRGSQE